MSDTALFTAANWKPIHVRTEPISESGLLLRIMAIRHRTEPGRGAC